jgi:hypothetical protein
MLKVHRCEDSKYDINWVVANNDKVMINRKYEERHEPTYSGVSIVVQNPTDEDWLMEYGHNEEGFLSVSDFTKQGRVFEVVPTLQAIKELEANTARVISGI